MKCECGRKAIYFRSYEGRHYCELCLTKQVERRFRKTVSENNLLEKKDKIAVALSGGKDSSTLLYLMNNLCKKNRIRIFAISVDEGIKGYRDRAIKLSKELTKSLGVKHHVFSFKKEFGINIDSIRGKHCTYCGILKRYLLNKKARKLGATKIAVGHNLNDEAQSIMMNFLRGDFSRFQRLGAFPILIKDRKFILRIKPLRDIPNEEIRLFAKIKKLPFLDKRCIYSKDNVRRDVMNALEKLEKKYPGTMLQIVRFYDKIRPYIIQVKKEKVNYCKCGEPTSQKICKACELLKKIK